MSLTLRQQRDLQTHLGDDSPVQSLMQRGSRRDVLAIGCCIRRYGGIISSNVSSGRRLWQLKREPVKRRGHQGTAQASSGSWLRAGVQVDSYLKDTSINGVRW
jgi:hypothetical protein